jgi:hypothetical protein
VSAGAKEMLDDVERDRIAREGYLYFVPLVLMELTRRQSTNVELGRKVGRGPMNAMVHARSFPPAEFRTVVRPNFDTLYSSAWVDVRTEPFIISVPAINDRFFMLPMYDMWTEVFASPGTRTNGSSAFRCALCLPSWRGELPSDVVRIDAPTPIVWIIGRTETRGVDDYSYIHSFQDELTMLPLSVFNGAVGTNESAVDSQIDMKTPPMQQVLSLSAPEFFALASELVTIHPPHPTDWNMLARLERIGFVVGERYDVAAQSAQIQASLEKASHGARREMGQRLSTMVPFKNGWMTLLDTMGVWGNFYLKRAMVAMTGLGANPPEESIYPSLQFDDHGETPNGKFRYRLHIASDALPPVRAFWSATVYDPTGFQVANELNRFALGDRDDLSYNSDGSLDLFFQHEPPAKEHVANWLPTPDGPFTITMRLYLPEDNVFDGTWQPPPLERLED